MRRTIHLGFTLLMVLILIRPFDCFAGAMTGKAADCCAKGKCVPSRDADDCCKNTVPAGRELVAAKPLLHQAVTNPQGLAPAIMLVNSPQLVLTRIAAFHAGASPHPWPPGSQRNLPLLI